jgi:hypothetical protein
MQTKTLRTSIAAAVVLAAALAARVGPAAAPKSTTLIAVAPETARPAATGPALQARVAGRSPVGRSPRITARIRERPLRSVLADLARQNHLEIRGLGRAGDHRVTIDLVDVPLTQALERLLPAGSFTVTFGHDDESEGPVRVSILRGPGDNAARDEASAIVVPADEPIVVEDPVVERTPMRRSLAALEADLVGAADPGARVAAIDAMRTRRRTSRARKALGEAVTYDVSSEVRRMALARLDELNRGPLDVVQHAAWYDADPDIRLDALTMLARTAREDPMAESAIVWSAANDPEDRLRAIASSILDDLRSPE